MSIYSSDICSKEEANEFKEIVKNWLNGNFPEWKNKFKIAVFCCYNGDVRLYNGEYLEYTNNKSSFRRTNPNKDDQGNIIGWNGYRGHFTTKIPEYISINRDEFVKIKKIWKDKDGEDYDFYKDILFDKLEKASKPQ